MFFKVCHQCNLLWEKEESDFFARWRAGKQENGGSLIVDKILEIARRNNLFVLDDAAQIFGAKYKENTSGRSGTSVFSVSGPLKR
jgi:hypothetical protein